MKMKYVKLFLLTFVGCLLFTACGDDETEPSSTNKFKATISIPAEGISEAYTISQFDLSSPSITCSADWLTVTYVDGTSELWIVAESNTGGKRSCKVVVTDAEGSLTLTVTQASLNDTSSDDDGDEEAIEMGYNNNKSSNPAYSVGR